MQHVGLGVAKLSFGERTPRPVVALLRGRQLEAQVGLQQHVETEGPDAEKSRGDGRVEDRREREAATLELDEVVVAGVDHRHDVGCCEHGCEGREIGDGERIHEPGLARRDGQLDEREALRIVMEAVALRVEGDLAGRPKAM